jgi:hypothetical protein
MREIFVVTGSRGEYSDRVEWNVVAFETEDEAKQFVEDCQSSVRTTASVYYNEIHVKAKKRDTNLMTDRFLGLPQTDIDDLKELASILNKTLMDPFVSVADGVTGVSYWYTVVSIGMLPTREVAAEKKWKRPNV